MTRKDLEPTGKVPALAREDLHSLQEHEKSFFQAAYFPLYYSLYRSRILFASPTNFSPRYQAEIMKRTLSLTVFAVFSLIIFSSIASGRTLTCESIDGHPQYCRADTRGGVRLIRKLSNAGCYEGQSWGYDERGIWVARGCRAQFEVRDHHRDHYYGDRPPRDPYYGDRPPHDYYDRRPPRDDRYYGPQRITCESWDNRQAYCRANLRHAQVEIVKQLSNQRCQYGDNWGWDRGGIWVRGGCRAVFAIHY